MRAQLTNIYCSQYSVLVMDFDVCIKRVDFKKRGNVSDTVSTDCQLRLYLTNTWYRFAIMRSHRWNQRISELSRLITEEQNCYDLNLKKKPASGVIDIVN